MSTALTFGTISALFGLQNKIITQEQYSVLVTVVILSAFVPTLIAQKFFQPCLRTMNAWGRLYQRKVNGKAKSAQTVEPLNRFNDSTKHVYENTRSVTTVQKAPRRPCAAPP